MQNKKTNKLVWIYILLIALVVSFSNLRTAYAADAQAESASVMVSLGDSYSSGEGIEPFYGQELNIKEKVLKIDKSFDK